MRKLLLGLLLLSWVSPATAAENIVSYVKEESALLLEITAGEKENLKVDGELDIPWNKPFFQFWRTYYSKRCNRLKLLSRVDAFRRFYPMVLKVFRREGLPDELALLAIVESNGKPWAVSRAGAAGLWQLMPRTARLYGLKVNRYIDERFDVEKSTVVAAKYLKHLYSIFRRWDLAIAAYNAGPGTIKSRLKKLGAEHFWDLTKLPDETLNYVPKFYAVLSFVKSRRLLEDTCKEGLIKIKVLSRMSLKTISRKLGVPYSVARRYNLQYRRKVVPANYSVYIPVEYVKKTELLKYTKSSKIYVYMPRRRERVATIAKRLGIDVALIKRLNRLRRNVVYRGQALLLVKREGS